MTEHDGFNLFLSEGMVEAMFGALVSAGLGVTGWVWSVGNRVVSLESRLLAVLKEMDAMDKDIELNRETTRKVGTALDRKVDDESSKLRAQLDRLRERLDETMNELPSKGFIEGQLGALTQRMDRMMDVKLARQNGGP